MRFGSKPSSGTSVETVWRSDPRNTHACKLFKIDQWTCKWRGWMEIFCLTCATTQTGCAQQIRRASLQLSYFWKIMHARSNSVKCGQTGAHAVMVIYIRIWLCTAILYTDLYCQTWSYMFICCHIQYYCPAVDIDVSYGASCCFSNEMTCMYAQTFNCAVQEKVSSELFSQ